MVDPEFYCRETVGGKTVYYCYLEYGGKKCYANSSIAVPKGSKVKAKFCVDTKGYKVALQVWDYKNWEELAWKEHTGGFWCDEMEFTAKKDADVAYVLYKYESGWNQVATYGMFYLRTTGYIPPKPKIVEAYLECGGRRVDKDEEITIKMPANCFAHVIVKNESEGSGKCAIQVWDWKNFEELRWLEFEMVSNQAPTEYTPTFTIKDDADIVIYTYYYDEEIGEWKDYDKIGSSATPP